VADSARQAVVNAAIDNVVHRLAALPASNEVTNLRAKAEAYRKEARSWTASHPCSDEKERFMRRALRLHKEVAELERRGPA